MPYIVNKYFFDQSLAIGNKKLIFIIFFSLLDIFDHSII